MSLAPVPRSDEPGGGGGTPRDDAARPERILLVGNPNVGKSVLFKNLTQHYVNVSNFPGTTVEIARARANFDGHRFEVVDTPGLNDLSPRSSEDAQVTRRILDEHEDAVVVQVADAKNLRRALLLTLQLADLGRPMVLVLNMLDELSSRGATIDRETLSEMLGIPVVGTVALKNHGTENLVDALAHARPARRATETSDADGEATGGAPGDDAAAAAVATDTAVRALGAGEPGDPVPATPCGSGACAAASVTHYQRNRERLAAINRILAATWSTHQPRHATLGVRLGFWAMHPVKGLAFVGAALFLMFWFVGLFGAGTLVDLMEAGLFEQHLNPAAIHGVDRLLPFPHEHVTEAVEAGVALPLTPVHEVGVASWHQTVVRPEYALTAGDLSAGQAVLRFLHDFLVGPYGAVTMALAYALAIVLPIVTTFFLLFSIMEDSGYLPRMAIMLNRVFRLIGLNGKAVLPMVLGLGCDTMATMTTRILETRKERIVTTMLLALAVPCSAQLGVLLAMLASLSFTGAVLWVGLMIGVILMVGWLTSRLFPDEASDFILEIPPMRRPQLANVTVKTVSRLNWYLREVIPLFVIGTAILFVLDVTHALDAIARAGEPLVAGWLGLPVETSNAFLVGFLRRDFGAVYLLDAATGAAPLLSQHQILVAMVTITLFMPCIANFLMIAREHGLKVAWAMAGFIFPFAFLVGGIIHRLGLWLTIF